MKLNFTYVRGIGKEKNLKINQVWEQCEHLLKSETVTKEEAVFWYHEKIIQLFPKEAFIICTNSPLD